MDEEGKEEKWDRREEEEVLRVVKYISWGGLRRVLDQRGSSATVGSKSVSSVRLDVSLSWMLVLWLTQQLVR